LGSFIKIWNEAHVLLKSDYSSRQLHEDVCMFGLQ